MSQHISVSSRPAARTGKKKSGPTCTKDSASGGRGGGVFVNQNAAFSDYHVTGANPAGNACLCDSAFVANRFRVASLRRPVAA